MDKHCLPAIRVSVNGAVVSKRDNLNIEIMAGKKNLKLESRESGKE